MIKSGKSELHFFENSESVQALAASDNVFSLETQILEFVSELGRRKRAKRSPFEKSYFLVSPFSQLASLQTMICGSLPLPIKL